MTIYLVFESSKGRKDLVFTSTSLDLAVESCIEWAKFSHSLTYRVYGVDADSQTFYVDKLVPLYTAYPHAK